jgi:hypothetical protein
MKEHLLTQRQQIAVEKEYVAEAIIVETLLLMDVEVTDMEDVAKGLAEKITTKEMYDNAGGTIPSVVNTEDIPGDSVMTTQEGKISVHQEILVAMEMVVEKQLLRTWTQRLSCVIPTSTSTRGASK